MNNAPRDHTITGTITATRLITGTTTATRLITGTITATRTITAMTMGATNTRTE